MNSHHNHGKNNQSPGDQAKDDLAPDHQAFDEGLNQLDQLYHSEELEGPPELLDQAVLNKARLAVEPTNGWLDFGWIHGVTTVALVVLTLSIFTYQRDTGEFEPNAGPAAKKDNVAGLSMQKQSLESAKEEVQVEVRSRDQDFLSRQISEPSSPVPERAASDREETIHAAADRAQTDGAATGRAEDGGATSVSSSPSSSLSPPMANQSPPMAADEASVPVKRMAAPGATTRHSAEPEHDTGTGILQEKKQDTEKQQLDSPGSLEDVSEAEFSEAIDQQQWLDQILALKKTGNDEWIEELADFIKQNPDFPLPEELQKAPRNKD